MGGPQPRPCVSEEGWPTHLEEAGVTAQPQAWDLQAASQPGGVGVGDLLRGFLPTGGGPSEGRGEGLRAGIHCTSTCFVLDAL